MRSRYYVNSSLRIQLRLELYSEGMYDTYAYSSLEHINRNIVMRSSRLDYDRTLLLLVGEVFLNGFLYTGMFAFYSQNVISCL